MNDTTCEWYMNFVCYGHDCTSIGTSAAAPALKRPTGAGRQHSPTFRQRPLSPADRRGYVGAGLPEW